MNTLITDFTLLFPPAKGLCFRPCLLAATTRQIFKQKLGGGVQEASGGTWYIDPADLNISSNHS